MRDLGSLLQKFYDGKTSVEEETLLAGFISDGETGVFDDYCRDKWAQGAAYDIPVDVKERIKTNILDNIRIKRKQAKILLFKGLVRKFAKAATMVALLLMVVLAGWHIADNRKPETFKIASERGQKSSITLPDGSRVLLNSASSISYTSDYNSKERNVFLQGEAYFEVAKNAEIPFIVHCQELSIEALGTKFNVKAYVEDCCIVTTLVEGQVKTTSGNVSELMFPAQVSSFDKSTGQMTKSRVKDTAHMVPWIRNEILFTESSLSEIAVLLERMYNVMVIFDDRDIGNYTYTGLVRNNSLQNVLELISATSPVDYRMSADTVKFSKND